jgi:acyl-CoA synthetase (AMP-forming)/AMP-acid ligase II
MLAALRRHAGSGVRLNIHATHIGGFTRIQPLEDRPAWLRHTDRPFQRRDQVWGEWISSVDLENHLIAHPAVREAAVVGVPDDRWQERPLAAVVLQDGKGTSPKELREFLADKVVRWWLPERWIFIDHVPRTSVGKYVKKTIRTRHANGEYDVVEIHD